MNLASFQSLLATCPETDPLARARWGGARADRLGFAFVAGYQAALARQLGVTVPASLAVTESGGGHPKAMLTRLADGALAGEKTFATLASSAEAVFVLAHDGTRLVLARVRPDAPGVTLVDRAPMPFAPEVPHARITLANVVPEEILPGDGFSDHVRPFRSTEDLHVLAAGLAYMQQLYPREPEIVTLLAALGAIAGDPHTPEAHLVLAGAFTATRRLAEATPDVHVEVAARWERDRPLLVVAEAVRAKRTEKAWELATPK